MIFELETNGGMRGVEDLAAALHNIADTIPSGFAGALVPASGSARDANGETVGAWKLNAR